MIYVDTESLLINHYTYSNNPNKSYTENIATHTPCEYSLTITKSYDNEKIHSFYRGEDCVSNLCDELLEQSTKIFNIEKKPLTPLTPEEENTHDKAKTCHICNSRFMTDETYEQYMNYRKVIDHDHCTGKYRGAAHSICNLRWQQLRLSLLN